MPTAYHIDPRIRALGKARLEVTRRAKDEAEWQAAWYPARFTFPFILSGGWRTGLEYAVDDFAAEIGFWIDLLGLQVSAFSTTHAVLTSPDEDIQLTLRQADGSRPAVAPGSLGVHLQVWDVAGAVEELQGRGLVFDQVPGEEPDPESGTFLATFYTPSGVLISLFGSRPVKPIYEGLSLNTDTAQPALAFETVPEGADQLFDSNSIPTATKQTREPVYVDEPAETENTEIPAARFEAEEELPSASVTHLSSGAGKTNPIKSRETGAEQRGPLSNRVPTNQPDRMYEMPILTNKVERRGNTPNVEEPEFGDLDVPDWIDEEIEKPAVTPRPNRPQPKAPPLSSRTPSRTLGERERLPRPRASSDRRRD